MQEISIGKSAKAPMMSRYDLWNQLCTYAKAHSSKEKQEWRAKSLYKNFTGEYPELDLSFNTSVNVDITRPVHNKIKQLNIAYAKSANRKAA